MTAVDAVEAPMLIEPVLPASSARRRLPNRREQVTETVSLLRADGRMASVEVSVGFDPADGTPREVFLAGAKDGSDRAFELSDIAVALSVALQSGVSAQAMARSVGRVSDNAGMVRPASVTGAALDLVAQYEWEGW